MRLTRRVCGRRCSPALEVKGGGTVVAAQQIASLPAAIAGVMVGGPPAPPDVSHQLPTPFFHLFGLRRRQQGLDLLQTQRSGLECDQTHNARHFTRVLSAGLGPRARRTASCNCTDTDVIRWIPVTS